MIGVGRPIVVILMAGTALHRGPFEDPTLMTLSAIQVCVTAGQGETGMIEVRFLPGCGGMALRAVDWKSGREVRRIRGRLVVIGVAGKTIRGRGAVRPGGVAFATGWSEMTAAQDQLQVRVWGAGPGPNVMTLRAVGSELRRGVIHRGGAIVVTPVAGLAFGRGIGVVAAGVAPVALQARMPGRQGEVTVVESSPHPGPGVVARGAIRADPAQDMIRVFCLLELPLVARIAVRRSRIIGSAHMALRAGRAGMTGGQRKEAMVVGSAPPLCHRMAAFTVGIEAG